MFVRVVKRKLRDGVALDFKLLESYRLKPGQAPKQRFLKQWTIRQGDIWSMKDTFLDDVKFDLDYFAPGKVTGLLGAVEEILRLLENRYSAMVAILKKSLQNH